MEHIESIPDIHAPSRISELSGQLISEVDPRIVAVGIGDDLNDFSIKYNRKRAGGALIENSDAAYDIAKSQLDPLLKDHLDYLDFIRKDKVGYGNEITNGKIYKNLYDNDTEFFSQKITSAQRPGIHAEILAVDDIIKRMKGSGKNISSLQDLVTNNVQVIVKGVNHGHVSSLLYYIEGYKCCN